MLDVIDITTIKELRDNDFVSQNHYPLIPTKLSETLFRIISLHTCEDIVKSIIIIQKYWRGYRVRSNFNVWEQIYHPEGNLFKRFKHQFDSLNI